MKIDMEDFTIHPSVRPSFMQMVSIYLCTTPCARYKSCPQGAACALGETDLLSNLGTLQ